MVSNYNGIILTQFAAAKAGLVLVNINPAYQASELQYCLNKVISELTWSLDFILILGWCQMPRLCRRASLM